MLYGRLYANFDPLAGNIADISRAYADGGVVDQALERAKHNKKLAALMGELQPIGEMAILEGSARYSKAYDSLNITVRIWGSKVSDDMHTKMDV